MPDNRAQPWCHTVHVTVIHTRLGHNGEKGEGGGGGSHLGDQYSREIQGDLGGLGVQRFLDFQLDLQLQELPVHLLDPGVGWGGGGGGSVEYSVQWRQYTS